MISFPVVDIQGAGRLVGQQDGGPVDKSARNGDALPLAARQFVGLVQHALLQINRTQRFARALFPFGGRNTRINQRQLDIVQGGGSGQQVKRLKNKADFLVSDAGKFVVVHFADQLAVQEVVAFGWAYPGTRSGSSAWICPTRTAP